MENESESNNVQAHDNQEESTSEDEIKKYEKEKQILLKEIEELKQLVNEAEITLNTVKYGDIQIENKDDLLNVNAESQTPLSSKDVIANVVLEYELYKLAGLYCTKSTNNEFVFNLSASSNQENSSAVQFFVEDDKVTIGNWVMPVGITIDHILPETPLEKPIHVIPFLRNCKRHILCYEQRKQQFNELNESIENITNCQITTSFGYLTTVITLYGVTNKQTNEKINLIVNLFYDSGRVRPHTLKINSSSEELSLQLRNYTKRFKKDTLQDAYDSIIIESHAIFKWEPEINSGKKQTIENNTIVSEDTEDSENDSDYKVRKRKRVKKQPTKPIENKNVDSIHSKRNSNDSEHEENETVIRKPPEKKFATRRTAKKLKVTKKKASSKIIQPEVSKTDKNTENVSVNNGPGTSEKSSKLANIAENPPKLQQKRTKKQTKPNFNAKRTTSKSSEKQTSISSIRTRSGKAKLNAENSTIMDKLKVTEKSILTRKKTYTSTPMAGNVKKTKQLTLNLSPIVSATVDSVKTKEVNLRRSPRKKQ